MIGPRGPEGAPQCRVFPVPLSWYDSGAILTNSSEPASRGADDVQSTYTHSREIDLVVPALGMHA